MKNLILIISAICLLLMPSFFPVYADSLDTEQENIAKAIPEEIKRDLEQNGITPSNGANGLSIESLLNKIWGVFEREVTSPIRFFFSILGVILLASLAKTLNISDDNSASKVFTIAATVAGAAMTATEITKILSNTQAVLSAAGIFMLTFIPVFAGILASTGGIASAGIFNAITLSSIQIFSWLISLILAPATAGLCGIGVAGAVNPDFKVDKIGDTVKKVIVFILGLVLVLFLGLLSLQTAVSAAADTVTIKAGKYVISSAVPIVGGAVADSLSTVKGSIDLIKATVGTYGIVVSSSIFMPMVVSAALYKTAISLAASISDMFGESSLSQLLRIAENVVSIMLAFLAALAVFSICSVGILISFSAKGSA